jgi:hypothetical protein
MQQKSKKMYESYAASGNYDISGPQAGDQNCASAPLKSVTGRIFTGKESDFIEAS